MINDTVEQGSYLKNKKIANTMHTALLYSFPAELTFGAELWNIHEKFLGHTDESYFDIHFFILGFHCELPKSLWMREFTGFYHYKSTWEGRIPTALVISALKFLFLKENER